VDFALSEGIHRTYPDVKLAPETVTRLKEHNSFVGDAKNRILARVLVGGKPRKIDITRQIREACEILMEEIVDGIGRLVGVADSETAENVLKNIILTGGGSLIGGICETLQSTLRARGYEDARVRRVEDYKHLVARGALKTAQRVRNDQWQLPM
jgi:rod shape-determining protein MreB